MDVEELDEFIYEFHERVLGITPELIEPKVEIIHDSLK